MATPFPITASPASGGSNSAALTLIATNLTDSAITIQAVALTLWIGGDDSDLTADSQSIQPQAPASWTANPPQYSNGKVEFSFSPNDPGGAATVAPQAALSFTLATIAINQRPGTTNLTVTEASGDCQPPGCPTQPLEVTKFPSDWSGAGSTVSFSAHPPIIAANDPNSTTTLSWSGPAGPTYTIEYWTQTGLVTVPAPGQPALGHTGEYPSDGGGLELAQSTTFYLTVADTVDEQSYSAQYPLPVTVEIPEQLAILQLSGSTTALAVGDVLELSWMTQLAASCQLGVDEGSGSVAVSAANDLLNSCQVTSNDGLTLLFSAPDGSALGSVALSEGATKATFRLTASAQSSNTQQTFLVELQPATILEFTSGVGGLVSPDPYTFLTWQVAAAASISIEPYLGSVGPRGTEPVDDGETYTLTAQGFGAAATAQQTTQPLS